MAVCGEIMMVIHDTRGCINGRDEMCKAERYDDIG